MASARCSMRLTSMVGLLERVWTLPSRRGYGWDAGGGGRTLLVRTSGLVLTWKLWKFRLGNENACIRKWDDVSGKFSSVIKKWGSRFLTLWGKTTVLEGLAESTIWYVAKIYPPSRMVIVSYVVIHLEVYVGWAAGVCVPGNLHVKLFWWWAPHRQHWSKMYSLFDWSSFLFPWFGWERESLTPNNAVFIGINDPSQRWIPVPTVIFQCISTAIFYVSSVNLLCTFLSHAKAWTMIFF